MTFLTILKYVLLAIAILYTFSNVVKAFRNLAISTWQMLFMAAGIVGYLLLQFEIGV